MRTRRRLLAGTLAAAAAVGGLALSAAGGASPPSSLDFTPVSSANPKAPGVAAPNILSQELGENVVAQGSWKLENGTAAVPYYGYDGNGPLLPQLAAPNVEASKTEPDKNTYLAFRSGLPGADPSYGYGRHFLFQGHETGTTGYITRINLDADGEHRVTLLATNDVSGKALPTFDGSTWEPWAHRLLFTAEGSQGGGVWASDLQAPANVVSLTGSIGQGGYEGIQDDSDGNIWIVEDSGGANKPDPNDPTKTVPARRPNSFVYRYVPDKPGDLANGELQALQVLRADGTPITFASQAPLASPDQVALHTYGNVFHTRWVTIHDTSVDGNAPYNANTLAKAVQATPFKRPENGLFRPGSHFTAFYFDETGDTNATSPENDCCAGWTAIMKLTQRDPSAETGRLTLFYEGDQAHAGLDNTAFFDRNHLGFVEDAGDTLHTQRNALDSAFMFDLRVDYSTGLQPVRFLAEGRDASATLDSGLSGSPGFQNEGDNEITGIHVSDGDPTTHGILGAKSPNPFDDEGDWRAFWTQQHGDNVTYELLRLGR
jgi:hypothetical protein